MLCSRGSSITRPCSWLDTAWAHALERSRRMWSSWALAEFVSGFQVPSAHNLAKTSVRDLIFSTKVQTVVNRRARRHGLSPLQPIILAVGHRSSIVAVILHRPRCRSRGPPGREPARAFERGALRPWLFGLLLPEWWERARHCGARVRLDGGQKISRRHPRTTRVLVDGEPGRSRRHGPGLLRPMHRCGPPSVRGPTTRMAPR